MAIAFEHQVTGTPVNTESARETFYKKLIQNTNLPTNHNFTSIITKINKEIEHHTQQRYPITYVSKGKEKLQTPAVTPRKIQPPAWKKNRVESPSNSSYHYTPGSAINISSTDTFPSTATSAFGQFSFQNRQRKTELLGPYGEYFEGFNSSGRIRKKGRRIRGSRIYLPNPITENPEVETLNLQAQQKLNIKNSEIRTPNQQRQNNPNFELINQQNLPPVIIIDQLPINPVAKHIQQLLQQPPQPSNLDPMAYVPITKLNNFTGKENDAQVWLNDIEKAIAANGWNESLANKPQDFNAFKAEFLRYFSNNNSINYLVNTFTIMKQGETEAQLTMTILQHYRYSTSLSMAYAAASYAVICAKDFESVESEANHAQAINLVMNGSSELDSKLEKFSESINKKLEGYLEILIMAKINCVYLHQPINSGNRKYIFATIVVTKDISKLTVASLQPQVIYQLQPQIIYQPQPIQTPPQNPAQMTSGNPRSRVTQNWRSAMVVHQLIPYSLNSPSRSHTWNLDTSHIQNPNSQHYLSLLVIPENATSNNMESNQHIPTNMIPPATISSDKSLAAIFSFELEENTLILLFSRATLKEKPIRAMYMDARVDGHPIKLILDSESAGSIITRQLMDQLGCQVDRTASARIITADGATKTPISKIDDFPIEINGIIVFIKVLVMDATQYQVLVAMCGHFKATNNMAPLIDFDEKKLKATWEAYQVLWADKEQNKLPPILSWDDNNKRKRKQKEELTWETDDLTWTDNNESEPTSSWE
ncbi:hypothetical protein G9A89_007767 [Geosiphon pyriformis]|nr:hypothetical protein G9A89_007767 [Geosiphon pyriformis]